MKEERKPVVPLCLGSSAVPMWSDEEAGKLSSVPYGAGTGFLQPWRRRGCRLDSGIFVDFHDLVWTTKITDGTKSLESQPFKWYRDDGILPDGWHNLVPDPPPT